MRALAIGLLGFFIVALSAPVSAQRRSDFWVVSFGEEALNFVDTNRIARHGPFVRSWVEVHYMPSADSRVSRIVALYEFDCAEQRSRALQSTIYWRINRPPTFADPSGWMYDLPGSAGDGTRQFVCATPTERERSGRYLQLDGGTPAEFVVAWSRAQ